MGVQKSRDGSERLRGSSAASPEAAGLKRSPDLSLLARGLDRGSAIDGLGVLRLGGHHALQRGLRVAGSVRAVGRPWRDELPRSDSLLGSTGSEPQGVDAGWERSDLKGDQEISHGGQNAMGWLAWS